MKYQAFIDFLKAIGAEADCPFCGNGDWTIPTTGTLLTDLEVTPRAGRYELTCTLCGYVRQHDAGVAERWMQVQNE